MLETAEDRAFWLNLSLAKELGLHTDADWDAIDQITASEATNATAEGEQPAFLESAKHVGVGDPLPQNGKPIIFSFKLPVVSGHKSRSLNNEILAGSGGLEENFLSNPVEKSIDLLAATQEDNEISRNASDSRRAVPENACLDDVMNAAESIGILGAFGSKVNLEKGTFGQHETHESDSTHMTQGKGCRIDLELEDADIERDLKVEQATLANLKASAGYVKGHRDIKAWKDELFNQLRIARPYNEILQIPLGRATIKTVFLEQYRRVKPKPCHFVGEATIDGAGVAIEKAYGEHAYPGHNPERFVLWTDGSTQQGGASAVVHRLAKPNRTWGPWELHGFKLFTGTFDPNSNTAECVAVLKALEIASLEVKARANRFKSVTVYTDSTAVLHGIRRNDWTGPLGTLVYLISKKAKGLQMLGVELQIYWVPGHSRVPGNVLADKLATFVARSDNNDVDELHESDAEESCEDTDKIDEDELERFIKEIEAMDG